MNQHCACGGSDPDTRSQPTLRAWPTTEQQLLLKGEKGRELRVVVNTNDPDYEHIYSIEALDDPRDDLFYHATQAASADIPAAVDSQKKEKVTPLTAHLSGSVRSKRMAKGEDPVNFCLLPMDEGDCQRYTLRWYFSSQTQACRPFVYGGCKGNNNRFSQQEECEEVCIRATGEGPRLLKTTR
uniref:Collagen, type VII, alpha 1 n=1 Tax=Nothobranchius korthausae TaxID=1143690 RepID=A0A1A8GUV6_9TELE